MPDAILDPRLLADRLVGVVDRVHELVHGRLGTRPYKVSVITRRWSGQKTGEGTAIDHIMQILPTPEVVRGGSSRYGPGGQEGNDKVTIRDVSFRYVAEELYPTHLGPNEETIYMLERTFGGDANASREFFVVNNIPESERGDKPGDRIGWKISLHEVQGFGIVDHTDA